MGMILAGVFTYIVTFLTKSVSKKLGKKVPGELIIGIIALVGGFIYYSFVQLEPDVVEKVAKFISGAFVVSQSLYVLLSNKKKNY